MTTGTIDDISTAPGAARSITSRRALPSGRAVVGALLVTVAAIGSFVIATGGSPTPDTSYLVTARSIHAGEPVTTDDFVLLPIELPVEVAATAISGTAGLDGATALDNLRVGELVSTRDLLAAADGADGTNLATHELTLPVPRDRTGQSLVPGDRVTVLASLSTGDGSISVVAVEDALVVAWETGGEGIGASGTAALTLALTEPATVMELAHLAHEGDLTVVRTTRAMSDVYPDVYPPTAVQSPGPEPGSGGDDS